MAVTAVVCALAAPPAVTHCSVTVTAPAPRRETCPLQLNCANTIFLSSRSTTC